MEDNLNENKIEQNDSYAPQNAEELHHAPSYAQSPIPKKERRRQPGCGMYVFISIAIVVLVALFISTLVGMLKSNDTPVPYESPNPHESVSPNESSPLGSPSVSATSAPLATPGVMPPLDGVPPVILDEGNPFPDIIESVKGAVVGIYNYSGDPSSDTSNVQGSGTGFLISSEGYLLTNAHVVDKASFITVVIESGREIEATLIGYDLTTDIAVLKIDNSTLNIAPIAIGDSNKVRVGEFAIVIGDPSGRELAGSATFGIISATDRPVNIDGRTNIYLQTDAAVNPGNSGGPLLNNKGQAVGIISAKTLTASYDELGNPINAEGLGFAIPITDALSVVESLITKGYIQRPGIGVTVTILDPTQKDNPSDPDGLFIVSVIENGPGYTAGLRAGDIIVECNSSPVTTQDEFASYVRSKKIGDELTIRYYRDGTYHEATIIVGDLNSIG